MKMCTKTYSSKEGTVQDVKKCKPDNKIRRNLRNYRNVRSRKKYIGTMYELSGAAYIRKCIDKRTCIGRAERERTEKAKRTDWNDLSAF